MRSWEAVGAFSEPCPFAEAVDEAAPASVGSQAAYPCETGGERKDYGSYYIRTNIPTGMSLFMATLHRTRRHLLAVRVVVRTHGSVFGDAERLAADNRAVPLHVVRTCAMELGVARTIEAIEAVDAAGAALSLDALADHLGLPGSENHPGAAPALPGLRGRAARAARPTATDPVRARRLALVVALDWSDAVPATRAGR